MNNILYVITLKVNTVIRHLKNIWKIFLDLYVVDFVFTVQILHKMTAGTKGFKKTLT